MAHGEAQSTDCSICAELYLTSDYRRYGPSSFAGRPALQGSLYLQHADGWYAGVFASTVDFDDGSTRFEFDTYAGVAVLLGSTEYNAELTCVSCDEDVPGPTCDFWQGTLLARQYFGDSGLAASMTHTPRGAFAGGPSTCSAGVEKDWRAWTFALSWVGTDLSEGECGGTEHCAPAVIGAIRLRLN